MRHYKEYLIQTRASIKVALKMMDQLARDANLFAIDENERLVGSLTDGDVRRGFINGKTLDQNVVDFLQPNPKFIRKGERDIKKVIEFREAELKVVPVIDENDRVVNVINFRELRSYLPVDTVIMAGGKGTRLKPLTDRIPKPLLPVGDKPILEHNLDRLSKFGIDDFWISINYLGDQIEKHFGNGNAKNRNTQYVREDQYLGTIGAVSKIENFRHEYVLVTNSDILTDLNYEDFFIRFLDEEADFAVLTIPYKINIPYAVLETSNGHVVSFKEKPSYTYYSNGGIYLMKKSVTQLIPKNTFYNATDLMEKLIKSGKKVISYSFNGYWLDIGKHEDYEKAQKDIKHVFS